MVDSGPTLGILGARWEYTLELMHYVNPHSLFSISFLSYASLFISFSYHLFLFFSRFFLNDKWLFYSLLISHLSSHLIIFFLSFMSLCLVLSSPSLSFYPLLLSSLSLLIPLSSSWVVSQKIKTVHWEYWEWDGNTPWITCPMLIHIQSLSLSFPNTLVFIFFYLSFSSVMLQPLYKAWTKLYFGDTGPICWAVLSRHINVKHRAPPQSS